jgi:hypothetical protein
MDMKLTGPFRRWFARVVDGMVAFVVVVPLLFVVLLAWSGPLPLAAGHHVFQVILHVVALCMTGMIIATQQAFFGNSLGKHLMSITVRPFEKPESTFRFFAIREAKVAVMGLGLGLAVFGTIAQIYQWYLLRKDGSTTYDRGRALVVDMDVPPAARELRQTLAILLVVAVSIMAFCILFLAVTS